LNQLLINSKQKIKKVLVLSLILGLTQISAPASAEADETAPELTEVTVSEETTTGGTLNFNSNEEGDYSYLVFDSADTAPTAAEVVAQGEALVKGSAPATVGPQTVGIIGLVAETTYSVYLVVEDAAGNISLVADVDFTTEAEAEADETAPELTSSVPASTTRNVAVDANIVLTFSEAVDVETGNITIKKTSDDSTVEVIDVISDLVRGTGTTTITVNPTANLLNSTEYYVLIAATAFDDAAGNSYAGIADKEVLKFATAAAPAVDGGSGGSSSSAPQSVITVNNPPTSSKWLKLTNNVLKVNFASQNKGKTVKIYNNQNQKTVLVGFAKLDKFGNATLTLKKKVLPGSLFAVIEKKIKNVISVE
jgi:methionine-rich copper-binding protein CopC